MNSRFELVDYIVSQLLFSRNCTGVGSVPFLTSNGRLERSLIQWTVETPNVSQ